MARSSGKSTVRETFVREGGIRPWKIVLWVVILIVFLLLAFYGLGGLYFSNKIYTDAFEVRAPEPDTFELVLESADADFVVLRADSDDGHMTDHGRFGLQSATEEGQIDGIHSVDEVDGDTVARRAKVPDEPVPATGSAVRLDSHVWRGNPETALGMRFEEIEFEIEGGSAGAWYVPGDSTTWMIFVHGKGAERTEALRLLPITAERGYHAMVIQYRNDPGVPQDPSGTYQYGLTEWKDVAAAARYARANGAEDLIVVGYSMGGANVMSYLLESALRNQTVAAVLDSPMLDFEATIDHGASQTTLPVIPIPLPDSLTATAKWFAEWRFDIDWASLDYASRWRDLHTPTLIIQGTGDDTIPMEPAQELARIRDDIVRLETIPDVGHVLGWNRDPEAYMVLVNEFLDDLGV